MASNKIRGVRSNRRLARRPVAAGGGGRFYRLITDSIYKYRLYVSIPRYAAHGHLARFFARPFHGEHVF